MTSAIEAFSRRLGVTPFITLLAGFELLLHRYSGQSDFVLGTVVGGRTRPEVEELLGLFVNTLPLRARFDGIATVADHVARVRQVAVGAYAYQEMPFDRLVAALNLDRSASYAPVVQVLFGLMPKDLRRVELDGLTFERMNVDLGTGRVDLSVMIGEDHGTLEGFFEYSDDLFDRARIERMIGHFEIVLQSMVANPQAPLGDVSLLSAAERHRLLVEWNDTAVDYPGERCIHERFEAQAARTPDAVAVMLEDRRVTYAELNARANQVAHHLIGLGVGPQVLVGLCMERSIDLIVGLIGILKAGGAYVPLDPSYPHARLTFMLADTRAPVVLTQQPLLAHLPPLRGAHPVPGSRLAGDRGPAGHRSAVSGDGRERRLRHVHLGIDRHTQGGARAASWRAAAAARDRLRTARCAADRHAALADLVRCLDLRAVGRIAARRLLRDIARPRPHHRDAARGAPAPSGDHALADRVAVQRHHR